MNIGGDFDQAVEILIQTSNSLPSVELIVMDDWCEHSGRISGEKIRAVEKLAAQTTDDICVLLISKGSVDASGNATTAVVARAKDAMKAAGFEIWRLERPKDGPHRTLSTENDVKNLRLEEEGFVH